MSARHDELLALQAKLEATRSRERELLAQRNGVLLDLREEPEWSTAGGAQELGLSATALTDLLRVAGQE